MAADARSERLWKPLSRALLIVGVVGFLVLQIVTTALAIYYQAVRPHTPQPAVGWTVHLHWGAGVYGTGDEDARLVRLFNWTLLPATLASSGAAIKIYKLGWDPRRK
jgi:hypothetical protein